MVALLWFVVVLFGVADSILHVSFSFYGNWVCLYVHRFLVGRIWNAQKSHIVVFNTAVKSVFDLYLTSCISDTSYKNANEHNNKWRMFSFLREY